MMFSCTRWRRDKYTILRPSLFHRSILLMRSLHIQVLSSTVSWRQYSSRTQMVTRWPSSEMRTSSWCTWSQLLITLSCSRMKRPCLNTNSKFPSCQWNQDKFTLTKHSGWDHSCFHPSKVSKNCATVWTSHSYSIMKRQNWRSRRILGKIIFTMTRGTCCLWSAMLSHCRSSSK